MRVVKFSRIDQVDMMIFHTKIDIKLFRLICEMFKRCSIVILNVYKLQHFGIHSSVHLMQ